jgi:ligand-binding SRPBCC domain-containing protein
MSYRLERIQTIPRPLGEVFAFFSDATNLERITPGFLGFRILTPRPIAMAPGTLIDYELRFHGLPLRWRTRIESFEPESGFCDVQVRGPYRRWIHRHEFEATDSGTRMRDLVEYELPLGPLGLLAHALFVRRSLERIFDHRRDAVAAVFGGSALGSLPA